MDVLVLGIASCDLLAYLDPGTGSLVFQMVIASLVSVLVTVSSLRQSLAGFITGLFKRRVGIHAEGLASTAPAERSERPETRLVA